MLNKKASLEISIQAIVIVVLAMTLLGLGLGFIRGQFRTISETAGSVQEQVKQQILDDLRSADKKLSFPTNEVVITKDDSKILAVGVKNTKAQQLNFQFVVKTINQIGDRMDPGTTDGKDDGTFTYNKGVQTLAVNDARVYPIRYKAPVNPVTKTFELIICDCPSSTPCLTGGQNPCSGDRQKEYDSKTFFVTIT